jgi:hypothetical protein
MLGHRRSADDGVFGCGKPAHWYVEQTGGYGCMAVCEEHCVEALREGGDEVTAMVDGETMALDDDGEIVVAPLTLAEVS